MTLNEFLKELRKTPGPWFVHWDYTLRQWPNNQEQCPLTAVSILQGDCPRRTVGQFLVAAQFVGISPVLAKSIVSAADASSDYDPALRRRLLRATVGRKKR